MSLSRYRAEEAASGEFWRMEDRGNKWIGDWFGQEDKAAIGAHPCGLKDDRRDQLGGQTEQERTVCGRARNFCFRRIVRASAPLTTGILCLGNWRGSRGHDRSREKRQQREQYDHRRDAPNNFPHDSSIGAWKFSGQGNAVLKSPQHLRTKTSRFPKRQPKMLPLIIHTHRPTGSSDSRYLSAWQRHAGYPVACSGGHAAVVSPDPRLR